jgi:hypothetical protein
MRGARGRFETARATVRQRRDAQTADGLRKRSWESRGDRAEHAVPFREGKDLDRTFRVWHERPDRWRQEIEPAAHSTGTEYRVSDGREFWHFHPERGARHTVAAQGAWGPEFEISHVFDPSVPHLELGELELEVAGRTLVAGREATVVEAVKPGGWGNHLPEPLWWGADDYELAVDDERGVLLRLASRLAGRAFDVTEVLEVSFDEAFPEGTFALDLPGVGIDDTDWLP